MKHALAGALTLVLFAYSALADTSTKPAPASSQAPASAQAPAAPPPAPPPCTMQDVPDFTVSIDKRTVMEAEALIADQAMTQVQRATMLNDVMTKLTAPAAAYCAKQKK